jgi:predicted ATPase/class 3 adenylate cyclase
MGDVGLGHRCSACASPLPDDARFCPHCGACQRVACGGCGALNEVSHRFCSQCGDALRLTLPRELPRERSALPAPVLLPPGRVRTDHAERRHITVLFCDLVDSTSLAGEADPEDFREIVRAYHQTVAMVVRRYGGHIAQYLGDGVMVYFGWPKAQEHAASSSLLAARGVLRGLPELNARLGLSGERQLKVRLGIHSGLVVVGEVGAGVRHETLAIGDVPHVAARLQSAAPPNGVAFSGSTRQLVREPMDWQDLGPMHLRGVAQDVQVFTLGGGAAPLDNESLTPLVGRAAEAQGLADAWQQAFESHAGSAIWIRGEAGIGKTRLAATVRQRAVRDRGQVVVLRCSPFHTATQWQPLIEWMESALGFAPGDQPGERYLRLCQWMADGCSPAREDIDLFALMLSLPVPPDSPVLKWAPPALRQRTQEALLRWLVRLSQTLPVLLLWEDLHWADPASLALIQALDQRVKELPILMVGTYRHEFVAPWPVTPQTQELVLERLPESAIESIVFRLAGDRKLPEEVMRRIIANTDGVPLFIEEFTRAVLDSGALIDRGDRYELRRNLDGTLIPESLRDSLTARLDLLDAGREVARHAAVIGRSFDAPLVTTLSGLSPERVKEGLDELEKVGLVHRVDPADAERYEFKHALVQVAAYELLLRRERQELHERVARAILEDLPDVAARQPELLGFHYAESQQWAQAATQWLLAGQRALAQSANVEAIAHLRNGLRAIESLPDVERLHLELALLTAIGPALIATTGFGSEQVGAVYARTRVLCERVGDEPATFMSQWGSWTYYHMHGELETARDFAQRMLATAERLQDPNLLVQAHWPVGVSLAWVGELQRADAHLSKVAQYYDPVRHASNAMMFGQDPAVAAECYRAYTLWAMGHNECARSALERAHILAAQRDHQFTTAWVLFFEALMALFRREPQAALSAAEHALSFSQDQGHSFWTDGAEVIRCWALAAQDGPGGLESLREAVAAHARSGAVALQPIWNNILAEQELVHGHVARAQAAMETAFSHARAMELRYMEIDTWLVKARLLAAQSPPDMDGAREALLQSLELARTSGARTLELRTARLWQMLHAGEDRLLADGPLNALLARWNLPEDATLDHGESPVMHLLRNLETLPQR